jgi:hypothetical protein
MKTLLIFLLCLVAFIPVYFFLQWVNEQLYKPKKLRYDIYYRAKHSSKIKKVTAEGDEAAKFEIGWINKYKNIVERIDVFDGREKIDTGKADDFFN